ncbi:hypothetical protein Pmani_035377 [Petrolisthes manimaculis]|uniref:Uncharacterized protein n=1 Tax=Petrolisthes manimaculis TaxID=1843537 RepID=A0AAE1TNS1_9EUCA|nr:hypothetical protein Pmani_035377 [Petrolisthes manimaculis]
MRGSHHEKRQTVIRGRGGPRQAGTSVGGWEYQVFSSLLYPPTHLATPRPLMTEGPGSEGKVWVEVMEHTDTTRLIRQGDGDGDVVSL